VFDSIGWGEILVLVLAALFIFGPDRLPTLAKDAAAGIKRAREAMTGMREQLHDGLGDDFDSLRDLDLRQYHPKTFIRNQLLGDDDQPSRPTGTGSTAAPVVPRPRARDAAVPPPFDADAT